MSGEETPGDGVEIEFEEAEGDAAMLEQRNAPTGPAPRGPEAASSGA